MLRRTFLQTASVAAAATATPPPDFGRGIPLGFDTYSIRAFRWRAFQLLDYAASLKLDTIQISSLGDYESLDPAYLRKVRDHASRLGLSIDAGTGCICPSSHSYRKNEGDPVDYIVKSLKVAHAVGSPVMRCYMGAKADRMGKLPIEAHIENTVKVLREVRSQALDLGVKIAIENHAGDMQAREVRTLIEEAGTDFVGSCLDTGNPMWVVENPLVTLEVLAPYVVTSHVRDSAVFETPRGAAAQWVVLGDGSVDFRRFVEVYRQRCPHASMQLEIITGRPAQELSYLEPEFWKVFPKTPASEFSQFVALAKSGHPYLGPMVIAGPEKQLPVIQAALKEQQRLDLERSLEYAKQVLGVGNRWKA